MIFSIRRLCLAAVLASSAMAFAPSAAHAQHVVTEDEAAKLNFDALTAAPVPVYHAPVHHVSYRHVAAAHGRHHAEFAERRPTHANRREASMVHMVGAHHVINTKRAHGHARRG